MDENRNLLFTWRTIAFYSTFVSTGLLLLACLSIIISLCDRKKKKSQAQAPNTPTTPKSTIKPAQPQSSAKNPSSPSPGGKTKNDLQASQKPKSTMAKSKGDKKSARQASNKMFAGALDKTQEESKRSAKSNSKESGENNNNLNKKEEQTGGKEAKDIEKKDEEEKKSTEPPPIVPEDKVQVLGNLDDVIKVKKTQLVKEIEDMGSVHEHDKVEKEPLNPEKHVVINEKKCKLYTTNNEETKEDDAPDDLI